MKVRELFNRRVPVAEQAFAEMVLREVLCLTWVLLDENFKTEPEEGSAEMI